ncbi:MAG TPA: sigma-54 dependent transcriptional regulator [Candidatus Binatia bacterium]|jgi:DNA-binding NtrC family response regulator|nr:sigma-54 dependent transcriptional regulator [Candidatus Binatia bacterium]
MRVKRDKILVVDDDASVLALFQTVLGSEGYDIICASSGEEALQQLEQERFDLLISDLRLPGMDGITLVKQAKAINPAMPSLVLTAYGTVESAVAAMKEGAHDYLAKPFANEELRLAVKNYLDLSHLTTNVERFHNQEEQAGDFHDIIGHSKPMRALLRQVKLVAASQSTILIQGESGTGKELVARAIHQHSLRREGPFVAVDCGALPEPLVESELFGHTKGAFTGAIHNKKGLFEEAHDGTLFLDEIGDTQLVFQSKLLRMLQEGEVRPVGSNKSVKVDVRVIAATNKDLKIEVERRTFRADLYYRLAVVPLVIPSLRQRREDIPFLVDHFVRKYCKQNLLEAKKVSVKALQRLTEVPWLGNVRELENVIERAILLSPGPEISLQALFSQLGAEEPPFALLPQVSKAALEDVEREKIREGLQKAKGVRSRAAKLLGISRATLYNKIKRYQLD